MRHFTSSTLFFLTILVGLTRSPASAEDGHGPPTEPTEPTESTETHIEVEVVGAGEGEREALQVAATSGLAEAGEAAASEGTLTVEVTDEGELRLQYRSGDGAVRERHAEAPAESGERTLMVTLLVRSLMDDEASTLLASLDAPAPADAPAAPVVIVAPAASATAEARDASNPEAPEGQARSPLTRFPVAFDFAPYVGVSTAMRGTDLRNFSLGAMGDWYGAVEGVAIGGVVSLAERHALGLQIGGVVAMAPQRMMGLQIGGVFGLTGELTGGQVGFVNVATEGALGAQIGFVNVGGGTFTGTQIGFANVTGDATLGAQIGFANHSGGDAAGVQIGFVNTVKGRLDGVQIGFLNIAEEADAGIGLINIYPKGRTQVSATVDTSGFVQAELMHGARHVHNILIAGVNPLHGEAAPVFGGGLGGQFPIGDLADLSIDGLFRLTLRNPNQGSYDLLPGLRATFAFRFSDDFALTTSAAYTVQVTNDPTTPDYGNLLGWVHETSAADLRVGSFLSFSAGVRFL